MAAEDRQRWRVIGVVLALVILATVADVLTSAYKVPAEFYPFAGLVIGAVLARIGGAKEAGENARSGNAHS